ncbi:MAG: phage major tail protein, TP901-1 family, partial [Phascolarctobacterium sp.]|nr:phage major tail protein, TP901-1 family [Phascolarctobacterium sp.]
MAKVRPTREANEAKLLGKHVLAFLNYGESATYESPTWALIGGQRSADYSATADEIDLTDKTDGGHGDAAPGVKGTELTLELIVKPQDETIKQLYDAQDDDEPVDILRWAQNGR